jgi:REP element-mobilizing transposase RayT
MARPLRLELAGALWHVTSRGNARQLIFCDDDDRQLFLRVLAGTIRRFHWQLHAYVLMGNHYHLLLETPRSNLSSGMHRINAVYSQKFNQCHERVGHVLQGRFKAILVEKERHLLELVRYVVLNPVRAGLVGEAGQWRWSNYRFTAGFEPGPRWLDVDWTISQFGTGAQARTAYREFVNAGNARLDEPWKRVTGQLFLGGEGFRQRMRSLLSAARPGPEILRDQRRAIRPDLPEVIRASAIVLGVDPSSVQESRRTPLRLLVAYIGRMDCMGRFSEIGRTLGVSVSSAHEIVASARRLRVRDAEFRGLLRRVRSEIRKIET